MKKILMTLIVSIAFMGSMMAQIWNPLELESHWSDFDYHAYMDQKGIVVAFQIDGNDITVEDYEFNYFESLEMAAFVEIDGEEQCRGNLMFLYPGYVEEYGDPYPTVDGCAVYYTTPGDPLYFKLYDHQNGILYTEYTMSLNGEPYEEVMVTGEWYDQGWEDPEHPLIINFITPEGGGITKDILSYEGEGGWYLLSSPVGDVSPANVTNMVDGTYDLYYYDQSENLEWVNRKVNEEGAVNDFPMAVGKGYLYANAADVTLNFPGTAYEGEGEFPLEYDDAAGMPGWNLMGNPYNATAYIDREDFYVMSNNALIQSSGAIEPMQGIFVKAEGADETVTFSTTAPEGKSSLVAVNVLGSRGVIDRAVVRFGEGRMLPKFQLDRNSTKVYIPVDGEDYAVVRSEGMGEVPVNFKAEESGSYTMAVNAENVSFSYLHLIDNKTGADVDLLSTPSYSFESSTTDYTSRFRLVFATGADEESFAFASNGGFVIANEGEATVQVVDVTGRILSSETIEGSASIHVSAAAGVYMLRLINGDNVKVQKVVVK